MQNKKRIAVFFSAERFDAYPFDEPEYRRAYEDLGREIRGLGGEFFIVRGADQYDGGKVFRRGWRWDGTAFIEESPISFDVLYTKGVFRPDAGVCVVNVPELDAFCRDKWATYQRFAALSPRTFRITSPEEFTHALSELQGRIVMKPVDGEGGRGVRIGDRGEFSFGDLPVPYLLQECIETEEGIPGIVSGPHDFRIISIRGTPVLAFIRTPPPGSLLANVARGGQTKHIDVRDIPEDARALFTEVDAALRIYSDRLYAVDMARDRSGKFIIIELNAQPALFGKHRGPGFARFHALLAEFLLSLP